jgi:hypothetical protein
MFNLEDKLDMRPGELKPVDLRTAIAIRELAKLFDVLLLDRPEDYFGYGRFFLFNEIFNDIKNSDQAVVFFSYDQILTETYPNRKILIVDGNLTEDSV